MRLLTFWILMLAGSALACANGRAGSVAIRDSGSTRIVASANKLHVEVSIDMRGISGRDPRRAICVRSMQCSGIESLRIVVNGRPLFVPISSFYDLADLKSGQIAFSGGDALLLLNGGDASEGYRVKIRFNANRVLARTLFSALAPDEPLQETTYHEVSLD